MVHFEADMWGWNRSVAVHQHPGEISEEVNTLDAAELSLEAASGECTRGVRDGTMSRRA